MNNNYATLTQKLIVIILFFSTIPSYANEDQLQHTLKWSNNSQYICGGFYQDIIINPPDKNTLTISSKELELNEFGVSILTGKVTLNYDLWQIRANRALVYREVLQNKISKIILTSGLQLLEPTMLVVAQHGTIDFLNHHTTFTKVIYRNTLPQPSNNVTTGKHPQTIHAWGQAEQYQQTEPKIYVFKHVSYTTCPPSNSIWQIKASKITFNKNSGKGQAHNAVLSIKQVPIFYTPYFSFPLTKARATGLLWPTLGSINNSNGYHGYYFHLPIYLNLAPNYDLTITPMYYSSRGLASDNVLRYLTPNTTGHLQLNIMPNDLYFPVFKHNMLNTYSNSPDPYKQAELQRLLHKPDHRKMLHWQQNTQFNEHWQANLDYNYVNDDYYLADQNLGDNNHNQLLQQGEIKYSNQYWDMLARVQAYQTLHPINTDTIFTEQYSRLPQLSLQGNYTQANGLSYFISSEATHFTHHNTPGDARFYPTGNRLTVQPGIAKTFTWPFLFITPRAQLNLTSYELIHQPSANRALPIFDIHSSLYFDRSLTIAHNAYKQTLEPEIYYLYIPYRQQQQLPIFDTTLNSRNYAQLFSYNRFSNVDRINDANQLSIGISTRFLAQNSGTEKLRAAIGEIIYLQPRKITLCQNQTTCTDYPGNHNNISNLSPLAAEVSFKINSVLRGSSNLIWNPKQHSLLNENFGIQYQPEPQKLINLNFSYVRDSFNISNLNNSNNDMLKLTDLNVHWPLNYHWGFVGRWSQDWHTFHFQNLFYGLQYSSCCWSIQFVAGKNLIALNDNKPQYSHQIYLQISLTGLGALSTQGHLTTTLRNNNYEQDN